MAKRREQDALDKFVDAAELVADHAEVIERAERCDGALFEHLAFPRFVAALMEYKEARRASAATQPATAATPGSPAPPSSPRATPPTGTSGGGRSGGGGGPRRRSR